MSHVYEIEVNVIHRERVEADTAQEAKRIALQHVTVRRLSAREVHDLTAAGKAITWKDDKTSPAAEPSED